MFVPISEGAVVAERYRIERVLGDGGIGPLFVATDLHLEALVALRVLRPERAESEDQVEQFLREVRRASKIRSEHVVRIQDVGRIDVGAPYVVTDLLEGRDLASLSRERGPLPVSEAVEYVLQACDALVEAHAIGVVHGNIRPEALFLTEAGHGAKTIKLLDLGLARLPQTPLAHAGRDEATALLGTPSQRSPGSVPASRAVDGRPDVRALAGVLAKLVAGDVEWAPESLRPFDSTSLPASRRHRGFPMALEAVLARCDEVGTPSRIRSAIELAEALRRNLTEEQAARQGSSDAAVDVDMGRDGEHDGRHAAQRGNQVVDAEVTTPDPERTVVAEEVDDDAPPAVRNPGQPVSARLAMGAIFVFLVGTLAGASLLALHGSESHSNGLMGAGEVPSFTPARPPLSSTSLPIESSPPTQRASAPSSAVAPTSARSSSQPRVPTHPKSPSASSSPPPLSSPPVDPFSSGRN